MAQIDDVIITGPFFEDPSYTSQIKVRPMQIIFPIIMSPTQWLKMMMSPSEVLKIMMSHRKAGRAVNVCENRVHNVTLQTL